MIIQKCKLSSIENWEFYIFYIYEYVILTGFKER